MFLLLFSHNMTRSPEAGLPSRAPSASCEHPNIMLTSFPFSSKTADPESPSVTARRTSVSFSPCPHRNSCLFPKKTSCQRVEHIAFLSDAHDSDRQLCIAKFFPARKIIRHRLLAFPALSLESPSGQPPRRPHHKHRRYPLCFP